MNLFQAIFCLPLLLLHLKSTSSLRLASTSNSSAQTCSKDQSFALLQFKKAFSFDHTASLDCQNSNPKMVSWTSGTDCCYWDGVTCDPGTSQVIELDLSCSWLQGPLSPNSSLFHLTSLNSLNLAFNYFNHSSMPSEFGQLVGLTDLNLSTAFFSGPVASEIFHLSKLVSLDLSGNEMLMHKTPDFRTLVQNLTNLEILSLDYIDMSMISSAFLTNMSSSLVSLSLVFCNLKGVFPENIFHLPNLQVLSLSLNDNLQGYLPKSNWSNPLSWLDLSGTSFSGELPDSIGNLKSLEVLSLYNCNFTGSIPLSLSKLEQLTELELSENGMTGTIPDLFGNLTKLVFLHFTNNSFSGQVPPSIFNLTRLFRLDISQNQLEARLPDQICNFTSLTYLDLSYNLFSGRIPPCLCSLPSLVWFLLSDNKFTGELGEFRSQSLTEIQMDGSMIQGQIPSSIFELVNLTNLNLASNNLSGTVYLEKFSKLKRLQELDLSFNSLSVITRVRGNSTNLPMFYNLGLSACNISEVPDFLRTQNQLTVLSLSHNSIHGQVPEWLSTSVVSNSLRSLDLSHNFLTRVHAIPPLLETLDLSSNLLQQTFPVPPHSMYILLMSNNKLFGDLPPKICNITNLMILDVSNNTLSGMIPICLGELINQLSVLNLRMNSFHGNIPGPFVEGAILRTLDLNGNQLQGQVPQSLVNCTMLEVLDLRNNDINDTYPEFLETLPKLQVLVLRSNRFHGSINSPNILSPFSSLRIIDVSHNDFTGPLPTQQFANLRAMMGANGIEAKHQQAEYIGDVYYKDSMVLTMKGTEMVLERILTILTTIDMSNNRFEGQIPEVIGELQSLHMLNFSHNSLQGHIPSSLGNMTQLESLDLSSNDLTGRIPEELSGLNFLAMLNLSHNQLAGPIPAGGQFGTFPVDSYTGNLGLCGFPLQENCGPPESPSTTFHEEEEEEDSSGLFSWKFAIMGYGSGLVIGFSIGYVVFSTGKPWWFVKMVEQQQLKLLGMLSKRQRRRRRD